MHYPKLHLCRSISPLSANTITRAWVSYFTLSILILAASVAIIPLSLFTAINPIILIGSVLLITSLGFLFHALHFWQKSRMRFIFHFFLMAFYTVIGSYFIKNSALSTLCVYFVLSHIFVVVGTLQMAFAFWESLARWRLMFISGLITLLIGNTIFMYWNDLSLNIAAILVAINSIGIAVWLNILVWDTRKALLH